jgi:hypothetical protein
MDKPQDPVAAETDQTTDSPAVVQQPLPAKFPVNPQRDADGNAVLYPGMTRFEGVSGLYNTELGEVVIIAPTFEALSAHVRAMGVSDEISRDACILSKWDRVPLNDSLPNVQAEGRRAVPPIPHGG